MNTARYRLPVLTAVIPGSVLAYAGRDYDEWRSGSFRYIVLHERRRVVFED